MTRFLMAMNRYYCRLWQRLPARVQPLPEGGVILVGNHRAGVDPLLVQASVDRPLSFLMSREYHQQMGYARWLFDLAGAIPVNPGGANRHALSAAIEAVRDDAALCLFPEGGANPPIPMQKLYPGAIVIAMETGAPIIPFRVTGVWPFDHERLWPPFLKRGRARVAFGEALQVPQKNLNKEEIQHWIEVMREAILSAGDECTLQS
jgi:1-acyl-sn-glycerol-3-phosphate acyltransferase